MSVQACKKAPHSDDHLGSAAQEQANDVAKVHTLPLEGAHNLGHKRQLQKGNRGAFQIFLFQSYGTRKPRLGSNQCQFASNVSTSLQQTRVA